MSRFTHKCTFPDIDSLEYGFDRPMGEYFIQGWKDHEIVWNVGSYTTLIPHPDFPTRLNWDNSDLAELAMRYEMPQTHITQIQLDLPI